MNCRQIAKRQQAFAHARARAQKQGWMWRMADRSFGAFARACDHAAVAVAKFAQISLSNFDDDLREQGVLYLQHDDGTVEKIADGVSFTFVSTTEQAAHTTGRSGAL